MIGVVHPFSDEHIGAKHFEGGAKSAHNGVSFDVTQRVAERLGLDVQRCFSVRPKAHRLTRKIAKLCE